MKSSKGVKNYNLVGKRAHLLQRLIFLAAMELGIFFIVQRINFQNLLGYDMGRKLQMVTETLLNPVSVLVGVVAFVWWLMAYAKAVDKAAKKFMPGNEMGSAKWGDVEAFNSKYENKERPKENMVLTQNARKMYDKKTFLNNNVTVVGGSGAGKTAAFVGSNLLQFFGCNIYTDPKGDTLRDFGPALEAQGIPVKVLDLCDFNQSMQFNPFRYIKEEQDVDKLIGNIIANTTSKDSKVSDPFWTNAEKLCEKALFYYIWQECPQQYYKYTQNPIREDSDELETEKGTIYRTPVKDADGRQITLTRTLRSFMLLLGESEIKEDEYEMSDLDCRFLALGEKLKSQGRMPEEHKAIDNYNRVMRGAKDTVRSIVISVNARFGVFNSEKVLRIFDDDEMELETIGLKQQALFLKIPDEDTTYNVIAGMLYTQLFQTLYRVARQHGNFLPIPVGIWMDEFANTKMPEDFEKILATCRSRNIYIVIILQSLAQIKVLYPNEAHEGILGNCDTFVYLGGNEKSSHKYVSETLGKWTIDKRTDNQTLGRQGSVSVNNDILGRELMTEDEVSMLPNEECIVKVRGSYPIRDRKCYWFENSGYAYIKELKPYVSRVLVRMVGSRIVTVKYVSPYRMLQEDEISSAAPNVKIQKFHPVDFLMQDIIESELKEEEWEAFCDKGVQLYQEVDLKQMDKDIEEKQPMRQKEREEKALSELLEKASFDDEQMAVILSALQEGLDMAHIEMFAKPEKSASQMHLMKEIVKNKFGMRRNMGNMA